MIMILAIAGLLAGSLTDSTIESLQHDSRIGICSVVDSIVGQADTAYLRGLIDIATRLDPEEYPLEFVEAALASFSIGQIYGDRDLLRQALDRLNDVERTYSKDACYLYQRGAIRRELGTRPPFIAEVWARLRDRDHKELAMRDFRDAAELRPDWLAPAVAMAEISLEPFEGREGRRDRWRDWTLVALDRYREAGGSDPDVDLWLSRLLLEAGSFEEAHAAARRLDGLAPPGIADLELAHTLFALGRAEDGADAYWRALDGPWDRRFALEMERDLRWIFEPQESVEWAEPMSARERADWVRRFWARRAARDLVSESELLSEHYARLRYVRENYRRISEAQARLEPDWFNRPNDEGLDDRGLIYIRMGEPEEILPCFAAGRASDSWVYRAEDGRPLVLHFSPAGGTDDWSFATRLPLHCYARLGRVDSRYNTLGFQLFHGDAMERLYLATAERDRSEAAVRFALAHDQHRLRLDGRLEFGYEWLFFRGAEPGTIETTLSYAIPIEHFECKDEKRSVACLLEVRASVFGRDTIVARGIDSGQLDPLSRRTWALGQFDMISAPGRWQYRVAAFEAVSKQPDELLRGNWGGGRFNVPDLWRGHDPSAVTVSSLVLARPGAGDWVRGEEALALNPLHVYRPDATVDIYYEIYGLPADAAYTTEIVLVQADDPPVQTLDPPVEWVYELLEEKRAALRLRFDEVARSYGRPGLERRMTVTLRGIGPGRYVLIVAIAPYEEDVTVYRITPLYVDRDAG